MLFSKNTNLITGHTTEDNIVNSGEVNHIIYTDNDVMSALSLGVTNTGILQDWFVINTGILSAETAGDIIGNGVSGVKFSVWRNQGRNGLYVEYENQEDWEYEEYKFSDLNITDFDDTLFSGSVAYNIIAMNNYVVEKRRVDTDTAIWSSTDQARLEFLRDVKSSKERCLEWNVDVEFEEDVGKEEVTYKLYLFDDNKKIDKDRKITIRDFNIVSPKTDHSIGQYYNREDGKITAMSSGIEPNEYVAGGIDWKYNEFTGKWESGTPQVIAVLTTNMVSSSGVDLSELVSKSIDTLISPENGQQIVMGSAIPITMQNANPKQWGPVYNAVEGQRLDEDYEKKQIKVYNISNRAWNSGEMVLLNRIDGIWFPISFGTAVEETPVAVVPEVNGSWEFMYFTTNSQFFFRNSDNDIISYDTYEKAFYKAYYLADSLNTDHDDEDVTNIYVDNGYLQLTSFDFMGDSIGGLRGDGHALATTQFYTDPNGEPIGENNGRHERGTSSAPFFGCTFPDGYEPGSKYDEYKAIDGYTVVPAHSPSRYINTATSTDLFLDETILINSASNSISMFAAQDSDLTHLPADIALNASPSGINGRPIMDIDYLFKMNNATGVDLQASVSDMLANISTTSDKPARYHWSQRDDGVSGYGEFDSTFDFEPKSKGRVQFRPLRAEVYAGFETDVYIDDVDIEGSIGSRSLRLTSTDVNPISETAITRSAADTSLFKNSNPDEGLKYNYHLEAYNLPSTNTFYPFTIWGKDWMSSNTRPAGAVGVIGAVCTVTADTEISFVTDNFLGMRGAYGAATQFGGPWYSSWGNGNNSYNSFATTVLYARVYKAWPRNQTVYDPRFFAVHHFNEGGSKIAVDTDTYYNGSVSEPMGTLNAYPSGNYKVEKKSFDVDIRVPTAIEASPTADSVGSVLPVGSISYSDSAWRDADDWRIDSGRRGKLLPYSYVKTTVGMSTTPAIVDMTGSIEAFVVDVDIAITASGTGYSDGDVFTTTGGEGEGISLIATTTAGQVSSFTVASGGTGFTHKDFFASSDDLGENAVIGNSSYSSAKVKIVAQTTSSATAEGFKGFIVRGMVQESPVLTDIKPAIATSTDLIKITPNPPAGVNGESANPPMLDESDYTVDATISSKDVNNKYDIFMHFHNDISHTWADTSDFATTTLGYEQMVTLEIIPK